MVLPTPEPRGVGHEDAAQQRDRGQGLGALRREALDVAARARRAASRAGLHAVAGPADGVRHRVEPALGVAEDRVVDGHAGVARGLESEDHPAGDRGIVVPVRRQRVAPGPVVVARAQDRADRLVQGGAQDRRAAEEVGLGHGHGRDRVVVEGRVADLVAVEAVLELAGAQPVDPADDLVLELAGVHRVAVAEEGEQRQAGDADVVDRAAGAVRARALRVPVVGHELVGVPEALRRLVVAQPLQRREHRLLGRAALAARAAAAAAQAPVAAAAAEADVVAFEGLVPRVVLGEVRVAEVLDRLDVLRRVDLDQLRVGDLLGHRVVRRDRRVVDHLSS